MTTYIDPESDPSLHRLEGSSGNQQGGLIIMKKGPSSETDKHAFKRPSVLGLDKLAAAKRHSDIIAESGKKKSKVTSYKDNFDESSSSSSSSDSDDEDRGTAKKNRSKDR